MILANLRFSEKDTLEHFLLRFGILKSEEEREEECEEECEEDDLN